MKKIILSISIILSLEINAQRVGIGTTTPIAKLEVVGEGASSMTNALVLKNSVGDTIFRVRNDGRMGFGFNGATYGRSVNIAGNGINLYNGPSRSEVFGGSIFPTDTSIIMW